MVWLINVAQAGWPQRKHPLAEKLHRDWRHIGFARVPSDAGPTDAGLLPRGSLATGRSRVGQACIAPLPDCQAAKPGGQPGPGT